MRWTFAGAKLLPLPEVTAIGYATRCFHRDLCRGYSWANQVACVRLSAVAIGMIGC